LRERIGSESAAPGADRLSAEDRAFLGGLAGWLAERRMAVPAVLFLESVKPLNFVGSQLLFFFEPVVKAFVGGEGYTRFARLMEDRGNVEEFLRLIEARDEESRMKEKEKKS
jgi:hypothetical protein